MENTKIEVSEKKKHSRLSSDDGKFIYLIASEINFDLDPLESNSSDKFSKKSLMSKKEERDKSKKIIIIRGQDDRTIHIQNLDLETSINELEDLFNQFGLINKVTIICDKYTGKSRG